MIFHPRSECVNLLYRIVQSRYYFLFFCQLLIVLFACQLSFFNFPFSQNLSCNISKSIMPKRTMQSLQMALQKAQRDLDNAQDGDGSANPRAKKSKPMVPLVLMQNPIIIILLCAFMCNQLCDGPTVAWREFALNETVQQSPVYAKCSDDITLVLLCSW